MNCNRQGRKLFATAFLSVFVFGSLFAQQAGNNTRRIGLFVGANEGNPARQGNLSFAQSDAETVSKIFFDLGGINREDIENNVLLQPNRAMLDWRLDAIKSELADAKRRGQRTELIFYYAGHSDGININLGPQSYPTLVLMERIQNIEADARIVILDMCYAGAAARGSIPISFDGCAVLTSTDVNEESWEIPEIKSTLFTNSLITGLRGAADANGDANISFKELYDFVNKEVRMKASDQNPQFNPRNTGAEETALTNTALARARFIIGGDITGRISIWDDSRKTLVSDVTKEHQGAMELALEFGDYQLRVYRENPSRWVSQRLRENNSNISLQMKDFFPGGIAGWWSRLTSRGTEAAVNFYEPPSGYSLASSASTPDPAAPVPIEAALLEAVNKVSARIPGGAKVAIDISTNHAGLSTYITRELTANVNNIGFEVIFRSRDELDAINRELDRQMSGTVSGESQMPPGQNLGIDALITGSVIRNSETTYRLYVNAVDLERLSLYPNSAYSVSILNDRQMQILTGNLSDYSPTVVTSAPSVQGFYVDLGGGYSWEKWISGYFTIQPVVRYSFTQRIGIGIYGTVLFPQKITLQETLLSSYRPEFNVSGFGFLIGPTIMLYKSEAFSLPLSVGISYRYLGVELLNVSGSQHTIGFGTNITGEYHFLPHVYGYLRFQFDIGGYSRWTIEEKKGTVNGIPVSDITTDSGLEFPLIRTPSIGIGFKW